MNVYNEVKQIIQQLIDIIYPRRCGFCGRIIDFGSKEPICGDCMRSAFLADSYAYTEDGFSLFEYTGEIRKAIFHLKYDGNKALGSIFACLIYNAFQKNGINMDFDGIAAVPISAKRLKERGYNQTELIAKELGILSGIPYVEGLVRVRETVPQNSLGISERAKNVMGAFGTNRSFEGMKVLLIDDIYTTGSTLKECTRALIESGAVSVKYCTVAKTFLKKYAPEQLSAEQTEGAGIVPK